MHEVLLSPLARVRLAAALRRAYNGPDYLVAARGFLDNSEGIPVSDAFALEQGACRGIGLAVLATSTPDEKVFVAACELELATARNADLS